MMYNSKMALAIKVGGRVLRESTREDKTFAHLPFGCEYSLMFKNLNSVKALVRVSIDGTDATDGTSGLIVPPNSSIDFERFIKGGNQSEGNRFKFIERTSAISAHRGNKIDDGLVRIEFEFERPRQVYTQTLGYPTRGFGGASGSLGSIGGSDSSYSAHASHEGFATTNNASFSDTRSLGQARSKGAAPQSDVGITVPGSVSDQKFTHGHFGPSDGVIHVMILQLLGEIEGVEVAQPITVAYKPTCSSCGKVNAGTAKFCSECGTGLQLI